METRSLQFVILHESNEIRLRKFGYDEMKTSGLLQLKMFLGEKHLNWSPSNLNTILTERSQTHFLSVVLKIQKLKTQKPINYT